MVVPGTNKVSLPDVDRTVAGMSRQEGPAAVQFAAQFRFGDLSGRGNREIRRNASVAGVHIEVGLEVVRQLKRYVAVSGAGAPTGCHSRSSQNARVDRAVVGSEIQ